VQRHRRGSSTICRGTACRAPTVRAISKVEEVYKRGKSKKPSFRSHRAIVYDQRVLSWKGIDRVSILTLRGR